MSKKQQITHDESNPITAEHLTANSRVLLNSGRLTIHDDGVLVMQPDGISWAKEPFEAHLPQSDIDISTPETAAGEPSAE